jgi:hypothetical protein
MPPGLPPRRATMGPSEKACHGLREVPQRLLLHHLGATAEPVMLGPGLRELPALLQVSRPAPPARPPVRLLLHRQIPHVPGIGAVLPQLGFLAGRRRKTVPVHAATLAARSDIPGPEGRQRRFLPGLKVGVSTPRP